MVLFSLFGLLAVQAAAGPLIVHDAIPVTSPKLREKLCSIYLASYGLGETDPDSLIVLARTEKYPGEVNFRELSSRQIRAERRWADVKKRVSDEALLTVARGLHESRTDHGHDTYPLNAETPYQWLEEAVFGVQAGGQEFPVVFRRLEDSGETRMVATGDGSFVEGIVPSWGWRIDKPIAVQPLLTRVREVSEGVERIAPKAVPRFIPAEILKKISAYNLEAELTGELHQRIFAELLYGEAIGHTHFSPGERRFFNVRDPQTGASMGYLVTQDLSVTWSNADSSDAYRSHFSAASKIKESTKTALYRRYAYFDLNGNRVDEVHPPYEGDLQGRLVVDTLDQTEIQHVPGEPREVTTSPSIVVKGPLRARSKTNQLEIGNAASEAGDFNRSTLVTWAKASAGTTFAPIGKDEAADYPPRIIASANGRYVLFGGADGSVFDSDSGKVVGHVAMAGIQNGVFSKKGDRLYLADSSGAIEALDPRNGKLKSRILLQGRYGNSVSGEPVGMGLFDNGCLFVHVQTSNGPVTFIVDPVKRVAEPVLIDGAVVGALGNVLQIFPFGGTTWGDIDFFGVSLERVRLAHQIVQKDSEIKLPKRVKNPNSPGFFERYNFESSSKEADGSAFVLAKSYDRKDFRFFSVVNEKPIALVLPRAEAALTAAAFFPHSSALAIAQKGAVSIWGLSVDGSAKKINSVAIDPDFHISELLVSEDQSAILYQNDEGAVGVVRAN